MYNVYVSQLRTRNSRAYPRETDRVGSRSKIHTLIDREIFIGQLEALPGLANTRSCSRYPDTQSQGSSWS